MTEPNPPRQAKTADIGLAIRDMLTRSDAFKVYAWEEEDPSEVGEFVVDDVDVSDPHNPLVYITNEDNTLATYRVRIVRVA